MTVYIPCPVLVVLGRVARPGSCLLAAEADRERMDLGAAAGGEAERQPLDGLLADMLTI